MNVTTWLWPAADENIYVPAGITRFVGGAGKEWNAFAGPDPICHRLLIFTKAEGLLSWSGGSCRPGVHTVLCLPPEVRITASPGADAEGYVVRFRVYREEKDQRMVPVRLLEPAVWPTGPMELLVKYTQEMENRLGGSGADRLKAGVLMHEIILLLLEEMRSGTNRKEPDITRAASYMERNYRQAVTREELALAAGMSPDHLTKMFKRTYGVTPMEYLNDVRIARAKQTLVLTNEPFRAVAHSVGYADEFYFSRKFRKVTGMSPSAYVKRMRRPERLVSLHHHITGHLLALGIEPCGALINSYYPLPLKRTAPVGEYRPDLDKLAVMKPDVIFTSGVYDEETRAKSRMFEHIAPTVTIPFDADWRAQLRGTAVAVGKEAEAEKWIGRYERRAAEVREGAERFLRGKTVWIAGIGPSGQTVLYGRKYVGAVLYGDLGANPPPCAETIDSYQPVEPGILLREEPDILVLTSFRNDGSAATKRSIRETIQRLAADPSWERLPAVRNKAVYPIFEDQHLYTLYTSYSHSLLLERMASLWTPVLSK